MILIDYSQVALGAILSFQRELKTQSEGEVKNLIRHCILSSLKYYRKRYGKEFGEMVICCDGRYYWRKDIFEFYKGSRKKNREASDLDWKLIFDLMAEIREDLKEHFPYRVIHNEKNEADDAIATLCHHSNTFGNFEKMMIISSDKDFKQLQKYGNVDQWSPMQKKKVILKTTEYDSFTIEHIVKGDSGDGIPNILSPDNVLMTEGARQKPVMAKRLRAFIEHGRDECQSDEERRCWDRNTALIDLFKIPDTIQEGILSDYLNIKPKGDKMSVYNYLMQNRCHLLMEEVEDF